MCKEHNKTKIRKHTFSACTKTKMNEQTKFMRSNAKQQWRTNHLSFCEPHPHKFQLGIQASNQKYASKQFQLVSRNLICELIQLPNISHQTILSKQCLVKHDPEQQRSPNHTRPPPYVEGTHYQAKSLAFQYEDSDRATPWSVSRLSSGVDSVCPMATAPCNLSLWLLVSCTVDHRHNNPP